MLFAEKILWTGTWLTNYYREIFVDTALRRKDILLAGVSSEHFRRHGTLSIHHFVDTVSVNQLIYS